MGWVCDPTSKTGTQSHAGMSSMPGIARVLEAEKSGGRGSPWSSKSTTPDRSGVPLQVRAPRLKQAMTAIHAYEFEPSCALLDVLEETPECWGTAS